MKDAKLNNLLGMEQYSEADFTKKSKTTKRTDVAKDVLQENAYVVGKDVLGDHLKNKEVHAAKGLNNLISLEDFTKSVPSTKDTPTKRTGTAKDVLHEKVKTKKITDCDDDDDDCAVKDKNKGKDKVKKMKDINDEKGLTAAQKRLPEGLRKSILKRQGKK